MKTKKEIRKSAWYKSWESKDMAEEALDIACLPDLVVEIFPNDELGYKVFAIVDARENGDSTFWLEAFRKKKDALALCQEMGWKILK